MRRRHFLATGLSLAAAGISSAQFAERKSASRMHVGLAAYSFRERFAWSRGKPQEPKGAEMNLFGFVDYCAEHGVSGAELTSYYFPEDADAAYFHKLKRHAFLQGVEVCGTAIGNDFSRGAGEALDREVAAAKEWIDKAVLIGAPHVRFFAGKGAGFSVGDERVVEAVEALRECAAYAGERGVVIGIENHGEISVELLLRIVKEVGSPWVGINLDSGNFVSDDPYRDFETCAPLAVNVQIKTHMMDKSEADLGRLVKLLRAANYSGYVVFEYEQDRWEEIPQYLNTLRTLVSAE